MEKDKKVMIKEIENAKTYEELYKILDNYKTQIGMIMSIDM